MTILMAGSAAKEAAQEVAWMLCRKPLLSTLHLILLAACGVGCLRGQYIVAPLCLAHSVALLCCYMPTSKAQRIAALTTLAATVYGTMVGSDSLMCI
jgi:hypothetical protein